jgi:hypothetical protein
LEQSFDTLIARAFIPGKKICRNHFHEDQSGGCRRELHGINYFRMQERRTTGGLFVIFRLASRRSTEPEVKARFQVKEHGGQRASQ